MEPEDRRDQILRHAKAIFAKKGFHDASLTHIIDQAKIARGTFCFYSEGKREAFGPLPDQLVKEFEERVRVVDLVVEELASRPNASEDLERIADEIVQFALAGLSVQR